MSTVAEQLKQGREAAGLTIQQAGEITKIRTDHLRALEEGNFNVFSAPVYIRGFVRCYATLLKLPVADMMRALEAELGQTKKFAEPPPLSGRSGGFIDAVMLRFSRVDWRQAVVVIAILVVGGGTIGGVALWRHYQKIDPLAGLKPGLYHSNTNLPGLTMPLPSADKPAPAPSRHQ